MYPGAFRPFTAQLLLAVLFVCWFLPVLHMAAQLVLLSAAAAVTLIEADPLVAEALRIGTVALTGAAIGYACRTVRTRYGRLRDQSRLDALTGIGNRRAYEERLAAAVAHAARYDEPLSLVLLDLDGFKHVNDTYGHPAGDAELQGVARLLEGRTRSQDDVFRLGGDEFALLLPGTPAAGAAKLAGALAGASRAAGLRTSLTAGVAEYAGSAEGLAWAADAALLEGKRAGKQQVAVAGAPRDAA